MTIEYTLPNTFDDIKMYDNEMLSHVTLNQHIKKLHTNLSYLYVNPCGFTYPSYTVYGPIRLNDYISSKPMLDIYNTTTAITPHIFLEYLKDIKKSSYTESPSLTSTIVYNPNYDNTCIFSSISGITGNATSDYLTCEISIPNTFSNYINIKDLNVVFNTVNTPEELSAVFDFECFYYSTDYNLTSSNFNTVDEWNKLSGYTSDDTSKFFICYNHPELVNKINYFISGK